MPSLRAAINRAGPPPKPKNRGTHTKGGAQRQKEKEMKTYVRGVTQGVAAVTSNAFGSTKSKKKSKGQASHCTYFNATHCHHLALPRAVGDYTVIRLTCVYTNNQPVSLIAPWMDNSKPGKPLLPFVAIHDATAGNPMNGPNNATTVDFPALRTLDMSKVTPSAFTVQIMNPNALQTTSGIIYIGRLNTKVDFSGTPITWTQFAQNMVSLNAPRITSAGKLALRGVTVDAVPFNMTEMSNFRSVAEDAVGNFPWDGTHDFDPEPCGFAPIYVYNPNDVALQMLVTIELRNRFDPTNPAQASHSHHPPASEGVWSRSMRAMSAAGNGVADIADVVAATGRVTRMFL